MALAQLVGSVRGVFNEGTARFGAAVIAWFAAHPNIIVQSVSWNHPDSTYHGDDEVLRIAYLQATAPAIGGTWEALFYQTNATLSAQDQFNAAFVSGSAPAVVPMFIIDVTDHERARTGPNALLVICLRTDVGPLGEVGYDRAAFVAQPIADIAAAAIGNALILDGAGRTVSASMPVTNVGAVTWAQDERNYVVYDEEAGVYIGLPPCSGAGAPWAAPASTTTTAFPCPTIFPETNPTTNFPVTTAP